MSMQNVSRRLKMTHQCNDCDGTGHIDYTCGMCNGSGEGMYDGSRCQFCKGSGSDKQLCFKCNGKINIEEVVNEN